MTTDAPQHNEVGSRVEPTKVTRQEELTFGVAYAPLVRRLGQGATQIEQAVFATELIVSGSIEADGCTGGDRDENGHSEHTAWALSVYDRLAALRDQANDLLSQLGIECITRELNTRRPQPQQTEPPPPAAAIAGEKIVARMRDVV